MSIEEELAAAEERLRRTGDGLTREAIEARIKQLKNAKSGHGDESTTKLTPEPKEATRSRKATVTTMGVITAIVVALLALTIPLWPSWSGASTGASVAAAKSKATPTPTPSVTPTGCEYPLSPLEEGELGQVVPNAEKYIKLAVNTAKGQELSEAARAQMFDVIKNVARRDASRLAKFTADFGLKENGTKPFATENGSCLSPAGERALLRLETLLDTVKSTVRDTQSSGTTSGIVDDQEVIAEREGLVHQDVVRIRLINNQTVTLQTFCLNGVYSTPPRGVPTSPKVPTPPVIPPDDSKPTNRSTWRTPGDDTARDAGTGWHSGAVDDGVRPDQTVETRQIESDVRSGGATSDSTQIPGAPGGGIAVGANPGTSGGDPGAGAPPAQTGGAGANGTGGTGGEAGTGAAGDGANSGTIDSSTID